jgi:hypothetical protein
MQYQVSVLSGMATVSTMTTFLPIAVDAPGENQNADFRISSRSFREEGRGLTQRRGWMA